MSTPAIIRMPNRSLPPRMRAGDLLAWTVQTYNLAAGSSVFYVLTAVIANVATRIVLPSVTVAADGTAAFSLASSVTSAWAPGKYQWVLFAVDPSANRTELAQDQIYISADPNGATPVDPRSRNEKLLANVRCLLDGKALDDVTMYKIGTRELTRMPVKDLLYWEGILEARVRNERIRRGECVPSKTVGITFGGSRS